MSPLVPFWSSWCRGCFRFGRPNGLPFPLFRGVTVVAVFDLVALTGSRSLFSGVTVVAVFDLVALTGSRSLKLS